MRTRPRYALGGYAEWTVPTPVASVIEASWTYLPCGQPCASAAHRVLPHTGVSLVVHGRQNASGRFRAHGLHIQGACESFRFFRPDTETALVAVRLRPEWVRAVLGFDATEVKDRILEVGEVPTWRRVLTRLRRRERAREVLTSLEGFVGDRLADVHADVPGISAHRALERIRVDPALGRLSALATATGVSERTLRRNVTAVTGMSPKWIQRVERLTRAVTAADRIRRPPWSELAFRFGFSDQAHLVREARALTGCTPAVLHRERRLQRALLEPSLHASASASVR